MRKYDKGEYVNLHDSPPKKFIGIGRIIGWQYYPEHKTYDYKCVNIDNQETRYFEEGHLDSLKILLSREDPKKMQAFYFALNATQLAVFKDLDKKKKVYTVVGKDLEEAKRLYRKLVRPLRQSQSETKQKDRER